MHKRIIALLCVLFIFMTSFSTYAAHEDFSITNKKTGEVYDWDDYRDMAVAIYAEAGGDAYSNRTRIMVGNVILNRVRSRQFPNTIHKVLTQRGQYGRFYYTGVIWPRRAYTKAEKEAVKRAKRCAVKVLQGTTYLPSNVLYQSEYRGLGSGVYCRAGGMYFNYG